MFHSTTLENPFTRLLVSISAVYSCLCINGTLKDNVSLPVNIPLSVNSEIVSVYDNDGYYCGDLEAKDGFEFYFFDSNGDGVSYSIKLNFKCFFLLISVGNFRLFREKSSKKVAPFLISNCIQIANLQI